MNFIQLLIKIVRGIFGLTNNEEIKKIYDDAEKDIIRKHQEKIDIEKPKRDAIDQKQNELEKIIEKDKESFKDEIINKSERLNNQIDVLEKELDIALIQGDMEKVKSLSQKIEQLNK